MGHEKHTILLVGSFNQIDHFDQMLNHTSSQEGQFFLNGPSRCPWLSQIDHINLVN
jgi:hypothetical protein